MRIILILFLFCSCSITKFNKQIPQNNNSNISHTYSFDKADINKDSVIDKNESITYFNSALKEDIYSPAYSFLFIISLVFVFVAFCILITIKKKK